MRLRGFSLIELLVVVSILAILLALLFPLFSKAREKGRQASCISHQRQLVAAALMLAQEHDEKLPGASEIYHPTLLPARLFRCPTARRGENAYLYNNRVAGVPLGQIFAPARTVITADGRSAQGPVDERYLDARHQGRLVAAFADGHVALSRQQEVDLHFLGELFTVYHDFESLFNVSVRYLGADVTSLPEDYLGAPPTPEQQEAFIPIILHEYSLYPTHLFARHGKQPANIVTELVFCSEMTRNSHHYIGSAYAEWSQPDYRDYTGIIVYNLSAPVDLVKTIHHEVYHIIDRLLTNNDTNNDPEWLACNPPGAQYFGESTPRSTPPRQDIPGFATDYALYSPYEDKGETFGYYMYDPNAMDARCAADPHLRAKVAVMKRRLKAFCADIDDEYWDFMRQRKIVER